MLLLKGADEICNFMRCDILPPTLKEKTVRTWAKAGAPIFFLPDVDKEPRIEGGAFLRWVQGLTHPGGEDDNIHTLNDSDRLTAHPGGEDEDIL